MRSNLHDMEVIFHHQTEKAVLVSAYEGDEKIWLPLSRCEVHAPDEQDLRPGNTVTLTAPEPLLIEKGLI